MNLNLTPNSELRARALSALNGKWTLSILTLLLFYVVLMASLLLFYVPYFFVFPVLIVGVCSFYLNLMRSGTEAGAGDLFSGFKNNYGKNLGTIWLMLLFVFLWALLLYIPGIIKAYSYAMTPYLLNDEPELGANATIEKSMAMMSGNKMKLFLLDLSFIGWWLLCMLTAGIGFLWLAPYMFSARVAFYEDLKNAQQVPSVEA